MSDGEHSPAADQAAGPPTRDPLKAQVLRLANRLHGVLRDWGRGDLAERITAEAGQWDQQQLVVVACGDVKRGKSSLLNAVLGHPGLLPVDADVATSVALVIRHGSAPTITVTRIGADGAPRQEEIEAAELVDVASMRGDPERRAGVVSVELRVDDPLLARGIVLIDTPGVGGMSRGHRDLALAALGRADALLFTISAQEPVARSELEFLVEASERTDRIVLVVTKSDVNTDAVNGEMIAENRAKLLAFTDTMRRKVGSGEIDADVPARLDRVAHAPVVLTSSYLAEQAARRRAAGREEQAERLDVRSGIGELVGLLTRSADQRDEIRLTNLLAMLRVLLADVEREQHARLRASTGDVAVADEIAHRQAAIEDFGSKQARWRSSLGNSIARLQTNSSRLVTRQLNRVRDHYRDVIDQAKEPEALAETLPADLERSLHGAWNELVTAINDDFRATLGALLAEFGAEGMEAVLGQMEMPEALRQLASAQGGDAANLTMLEDGLPIAMQTFTFANIANAAAGALGVATGGLGFIAYGIGAAIAYPIGKMRAKAKLGQRLRAEQQRFVAELLFGQEGVAKEFNTELSLRIIDLREEVERFVEQRLAERRKQLEAEHRELQGLLRAEAGKRMEAERAAQARLADVAKLRAELDPLQRAVDGRLAGTPSGGGAG
jgi:hypothetical protein